MLRRNKKIVATLLTTCAIVGVMPTMGVHASEVKRLDDQDGIVSSVVPFANGKFIIDGDLEYSDSLEDYKYSGVYLYDGSTFELLDDDIDSGAELERFGDKYVNIENGDYCVDLETKKVSDDDIVEDTMDDAKTALRKKFKKVDRYDEYDELPSLTSVKSNDFMEAWYEYEVNGYTGYSDKKGNYVDADYNVGTVNVLINGTRKKFTNTDDTERVGDKKYKLFISNSKTLGQDKDNIYRLAKLEIKEYDEVTKTWVTPTVKVIMNAIKDKGSNIVAEDDSTLEVETNVTTGGSVSVETKVEGQTSMKVIQKISKSQHSDDIDDAKYAKNVTSTELISDEDKDDTIALLDEDNVTIVGNKIISWSTDDSEVEVQVLTAKSKNGVTYYDEETSKSEDFDALDVDVDGNLWRLDSGYIYKFDNEDDWTKVYRVDGAMDQLSVYNKNSLIAWNEDDECYSIVSNKTVVDDEKEDTATGEEVTGEGEQGSTGTLDTWKQNSDGSWNYFENGVQVKNQWVQSAGNWYFLKEDGTMATGWLLNSNTWYFLNPTGSMATGWVNDNGTWYYMDKSGAMKTGWLKDTDGTWYYLQSNGAMKTGWLKDTDGTWYYLKSNGAMAHDTTVDGYKLASNGAWVK